MSRHRRKPVWPLVRRRRYLALVRAYTDLRDTYRALETDLQAVLEDHEGLLYELERPEEGQTRWGRENERALDGLDPDRAAALVRTAGMLAGPSGYASGSRGTTD